MCFNMLQYRVALFPATGMWAWRVWTSVGDWLVNRLPDRKRHGMFETMAKLSSAAPSTEVLEKMDQTNFRSQKVVAHISSWIGAWWCTGGGNLHHGWWRWWCPSCLEKRSTMRIHLDSSIFIWQVMPESDWTFGTHDFLKIVQERVNSRRGFCMFLSFGWNRSHKSPVLPGALRASRVQVRRGNPPDG